MKKTNKKMESSSYTGIQMIEIRSTLNIWNYVLFGYGCTTPVFYLLTNYQACATVGAASYCSIN